MQNKLIALAATLLLSNAALAAETPAAQSPTPAPARSSSVLSGRTVGSGNTFLHGEMGWPGLSLGVLQGLSPRLDVGGKLSLLYGYEGITERIGVPGMKLQGVLRLNLLEKGRLNLGLRFSPGMVFYFFSGLTDVGLTLPVELAMGFSVGSSLMLNMSFELPTVIMFGYYGGMLLPMRLGAGLEYAIDRSLGLTFNLRAGPSSVAGYYSAGYSICYDRLGRAYRCGSPVSASMEMLVGLAFKL